MPNSEEPVAGAESAEQRIAAALKEGDYATVARLAQEAAEAKAASEAAATESAPVPEPAESAEAKAAREAATAEQAELQKQQDTQQAAEILARLQANAGASASAEQQTVEVAPAGPSGPDEYDIGRAQAMQDAGKAFRDKAVETSGHVEDGSLGAAAGWGSSVAETENRVAASREDRAGRIFDLKYQYPNLADEEIRFLNWKQEENRKPEEINDLFKAQFGKDLGAAQGGVPAEQAAQSRPEPGSAQEYKQQIEKSKETARELLTALDDADGLVSAFGGNGLTIQKGPLEFGAPKINLNKIDGSPITPAEQEAVETLETFLGRAGSVVTRFPSETVGEKSPEHYLRLLWGQQPLNISVKHLLEEVKGLLETATK